MNWEKVVSVLTLYEKRLNSECYPVWRTDNPIAFTQTAALCHCNWMCGEVKSWGPDRLEKAFRWLGFIQGVLWSHRIYSLDELKEHNRP